MANNSRRLLLKLLLWIPGVIIALVILIPALLYVPPIQDFVKDIAVKEASKATGMGISIDRLRLRWPLRLSVEGVEITEASGDTMLTAGRLDVGVGLLPLFKGNIDINYARLDSARYNLGNRDSLMWLRASVDHFELTASSLKMSMENIDLDRAIADGVRVNLTIKPDTTATENDTTTSSPMVIHARDIELRNVSYTMSMVPTIDSLGCEIPILKLSDGTVDITHRRIHAGYIGTDSINATYLTPSAAWLREYQQPDIAETSTETTPDSLLWTITADSLRLTANRARYATRGVRPSSGLDMSYLEVSDVEIAVDSFYNRGTSVTVPLRRLSATERCGLYLDASGTFGMTPSTMTASNFKIATNTSTLALDAQIGTGDIATNPTVPLKLAASGTIGLGDIVKVLPSTGRLVASLPRPQLLFLDADIDGTSGALDINKVKLRYPGTLWLSANGHIDNPLDFKKLAGKIALNGKMKGMNNIKRSLIDAHLSNSFALPSAMTIDGTINYRPSMIAGKVSVTADNGHLAAKGFWNRSAKGYDATLITDRFPVDAFMPTLGVGKVSAGISVKGHGYDPFASGTEMNVDMNVASVIYNKKEYTDILLNATLTDGHAEGTLSSGNSDADLDIDFDATINHEGMLAWDIDGNVRNLDIKAIGLSEDDNAGSLSLISSGTYNSRSHDLNADVAVSHIDWLSGTTRMTADSTTANIALTDTSASARIANGDLLAVATSSCGLPAILTGLDSTMATVNRQIKSRSIDIDSLQNALPPLNISINMGPRNIVSEYISGHEATGPRFNSLALTISTDSLISLTGATTGFSAGTTKLDTINISAIQHGHFLVYTAMINNRPGTMDDFAHITLNGFISANRLGALLRQKNIHDEAGYRIGVGITADDSTATLRFIPRNPMIAYKEWTVNDDNFISYNFINQSIKANLELSNKNSLLKLISQPVPGGHGEDITLKLENMNLQDWLAVSPFAPPITGNASADMNFLWDHRQLTGNGTVSIADLTYDRQRVGTFDIDIDMANDPGSGALHTSMALMVDSVKTITVDGILNDTTSASPFGLNFNMIHFPLATVNPFLPKGTAKLSGSLNGRMDISGNIATPRFNGWLAFDSAAVKVNMLGTTFTLTDNRIPVDSNIVKLDNFTIKGCNENPLSVNGTIDMRSTSAIGLKLKLLARNMMVINSTRAHGADAYGKAYVDLDADIKGNLALLRVDASAAVLPGTNVTYILAGATSNLPGTESADDIVKFVSLNDTSAIVQPDSVAQSLALILNADLSIIQGSTINADLSTDGKNRVSVQGQGDFDFSMSPVNSGRLTGRYTIDKGFVRYTPPFMSEKLFDFEEGSYIAFNGDMMNPTLNIHAVDKVKANVTQSGQDSRLVTFDVALAVTGTLQNMNVGFNMSTNDDITVQNELQSMSPEQRANQAMNLLLYNVYTGPGTTGKSNLGGNPLFAFLESQINSWAANNIKGVDISFGIEQYDRTYEGNTSTATSYSYRVSKSLFNDRFKIVVGGNYTTDGTGSEDENIAENLINDISFEYMLNRSGSMYVRIFRHTGYESILEGEVTQTGVGFVLKRKINSLRDLFRFRRRRPATTAVPYLPGTPTDTVNISSR